MKSLWCALGVHDWYITQHAVYPSETAERLGISTQNTERACTRCGREQYEDVHCLGLNPPEYVRTWLNR